MLRHLRPSRQNSAFLLVAAVLICTFVLGVGVGRLSAQVVAADAAWWGSVRDDARPDVVHSGIDGYIEGWDRGSDAEGYRIDRGVIGAADAGLITKQAAQLVHNLVYKKDSQGVYVSYQAEPSFSKTFGAYMDLIDDFYTRHPGATKAKFGAILTCLSDQPVFLCDDVAKYAQ